MVVNYWFVKARHVRTGREVQRIAVPRPECDGRATAATASDDMRAYLVRVGMATDGAVSWQIVEVHRLGESPVRR